MNFTKRMLAGLALLCCSVLFLNTVFSQSKQKYDVAAIVWPIWKDI